MSFLSPEPPAKVEPAPTRDTAADATNAENEANLKRARLQGMASTMLTGSSGVTSELTGSRSLTNG